MGGLAGFIPNAPHEKEIIIAFADLFRRMIARGVKGQKTYHRYEMVLHRHHLYPPHCSYELSLYKDSYELFYHKDAVQTPSKYEEAVGKKSER